jgi:hypothetical protein
MHRLLLKGSIVLSFLILLISCSGGSKISNQSSSKLFTLSELVNFYNTCKTPASLQEKLKPLGFYFKEVVTQSTGKTHIYLRTFTSNKVTYTQTAAFMDKNGYPRIGFSTPASLNTNYFQDIKNQAAASGFTLHENSDLYIVKKNNVFISMRDKDNEKGVRTFSFFVY